MKKALCLGLITGAMMAAGSAYAGGSGGCSDYGSKFQLTEDSTQELDDQTRLAKNTAAAADEKAAATQSVAKPVKDEPKKQ